MSRVQRIKQRIAQQAKDIELLAQGIDEAQSALDEVKSRLGRMSADLAADSELLKEWAKNDAQQ